MPDYDSAWVDAQCVGVGIEVGFTVTVTVTVGFGFGLCFSYVATTIAKGPPSPQHFIIHSIRLCSKPPSHWCCTVLCFSVSVLCLIVHLVGFAAVASTGLTGFGNTLRWFGSDYVGGWVSFTVLPKCECVE